MNRLAPLVRRLPEPPGPARLAAVGAPPADTFLPADAPPVPASDLRLFAAAWAGGVVFFGTMLA